MLSERDRRVLARMEEDLALSDPHLVRMFHEGPPRTPGHGLPSVLIVLGLVLAVAGSMIAVVPLALLGVGFIGTALCVAVVRAHAGRPGLA
jgi:hypothetical protein